MFLGLATWLWATGLAAVEIPQPKAVTAAERAAIDLVLAHLRGDQEAIWQALAELSPLRMLGPDEAMAEVAVRFGAADGATWTLVTPGPGVQEDHVIFVVESATGLTDHLLLSMAEIQGQWRLEDVRCLVDPWPRPPEAAWRDTSSVSHRGPGGAGDGGPMMVALVSLALVVWLAIVMPVSPVVPRRRWGLPTRLPARTALGALSLLAFALLLACADAAPPAAPAKAEEATPTTRLAALGAFRQQVATATAAQDVSLDGVPEDLRPHAALWRLQALLDRGAISAARTAVEALPDPSRHLPLHALIELDLAFWNNDPGAATRAFEDAVDAGVDHDFLRIEAAGTIAVIGDSMQIEPILRSAANAGSRRSEVYYALAAFAGADNDLQALRSFIEVGWRLEPVPREDILADGLLAAVAALPDTFPVFELSSADEPVVPARTGSLAPLTLVGDERAFVVGDRLTVHRGSSTLTLPGGGMVAPADAVVENAAAARERQWTEAVDALDDTVARAGESLATFLEPKVMLLANALAANERWSDLDTLTASMTLENVGRVPPRLAKLRARALEKLGRGDEGRRLLVALAQGNQLAKRRDPGTLYQLAESFVELGDYDLAIELLERARKQSAVGGRPKRIEQIRLEQALMDDHRRLRKGGFEIVYPSSTGERYPQAVAAVLEAELKRIGTWVPLVRGGPPIEVQLYPLRAFLEAYSRGSGLFVLGLYDGRVRIPFADVASLNDRVVSILSHELTHALIARATDDRAPHWLQEGVAEHAQMRQDRLNPFPELHAAGRVLAVPVVDAALNGLGEAQFTDLAYSEAAWFIHWVEHRFGASGVRKLVAAFRDTADTSLAIERALGMSVARFQEEAVAWARADAPQVWPTVKVAYDGAFIDQVLASASDLPAARRPVMEITHQRRAGDRRLMPGAEERALPRVGTRVGRKPTVARPAAQAIRAWHARYSRTTASSKRLLGALLAGRRSGTALAPELCRDLEASVRAVRGSDALEAPDRLLRQQLEGAYSALYAAARGCLDGKDAAVGVAIKRAEQQLAQAAGRLRPLGLSP